MRVTAQAVLYYWLISFENLAFIYFVNIDGDDLELNKIFEMEFSGTRCDL